MKRLLTIAGSDCSGGAGIQADLKTFSALGTFGMSVIVSVVAENTSRVVSVQNIDNQIIKDQIMCIYEDIGTDAVKIGMLGSKDIMLQVKQSLLEYRPKNIVLDPVMYAKNGYPLMDVENIETLITELVPICDVLTPNIPEAEHISGMKIETEEDMMEAAKIIYKMGVKNVLIKGGHSKGDATDILYDGKEFYRYTTKRVHTKNTHGTGCTLSSAIATFLAKGESISDAIKHAKEYVTMAIENSLEIGKGNGPTNHFYGLYKKAGIL
ncbi:MAG: bifunctional hydroxymethylpyrimidine kinase/phosphomethylpyrimidine kinase [Tissierellia bacterium]|nr:bifunctional hydroxymethylpyrimidine kinase/phosphomethylpyrimidine kinase [Tissierellia bacterium]